MSQMEAYYGTFRKSSVPVNPADTDDLYDDLYKLEKEYGCHFVMVDGQLYSFDEIEEIDFYGDLSIVIPPTEIPTDEVRFVCAWYNGGADIHEVVENLIRGYVNRATQETKQ